MRNELLSWFAREGLLLTDVVSGVEPDDIQVKTQAPLVALSRASHDFRECPDPELSGFPMALKDMTLDDMHRFILYWFEAAVKANKVRCFVCNRRLDMSEEKPWDAVFVSHDLYCWLLVHFDCKRYLNRDLKGRHPFEIEALPPEKFDLHFT